MVYAKNRRSKLVKILKFAILLLATIFVAGNIFAAEFDRLIIPRVRYGGGGDWYTDPTAMPNLLKQAQERLQIPTQPENIAITLSDPDLFRYPMLFLTGHGPVRFRDHEINTLLSYLENGGFIWVDDCYGMDQHIRREFKRIYPDRELQLLPSSHPIFNMVYEFEHGLPKIHEHDGKPPAAYAIFDQGRMVILYTYETDLGCGLEDEQVHPEQTPEIREKAMRMALNILVYVMMQ